jgi:hypothetical protein
MRLPFIDSDTLYTGALNLDLDLDGIMNTVQHQLCTSSYMWGLTFNSHLENTSITDSILSIIVEAKFHKTSWTQSLFIEMPVPSQESEYPWIYCARGTGPVLHLCFWLGVGVVLTVWYILIFILIPYLRKKEETNLLRIKCICYFFSRWTTRITLTEKWWCQKYFVTYNLLISNVYYGILVLNLMVYVSQYDEFATKIDLNIKRCLLLLFFLILVLYI